MTGHLRDYLRYIFVFFIVLVGGLLIWNGPFTFHHQSSTSVHTYEWLLVFIMFTASITLVFVRSRLAAILLNGVLGFSIAFFFVLFRAPDLALTQLVVETVTTALFLLCFYFLPEWKSNEFTLRTKRFNALLSIFVGLIFIVVAFAVQGDARFDSISDYFENAYELTGGKNIVNSILADFRAFDTMLEVVVIFIAGMGVYTLTKHKIRKEDQKFEDQ